MAFYPISLSFNLCHTWNFRIVLSFESFLLDLFAFVALAVTHEALKKYFYTFHTLSCDCSCLVFQELPNEQFNYGFYMDSSLSGRPAKYLDESRLLSDYSLKGVTQLEVIFV